MIVSFRHRYIFVHIPKTAGTALTLALEQKVGPDDLLIGDTPKARRRRHRLKGLTSRGRLWKHSTLADIEGAVDPAIFSEFVVFTIVRNPWDRLVSYYGWLQTQSFDHPAVRLAKATSFQDFLRDPGVQSSFAVSPAARYTSDSQGRDHCDLVLKTEALEEDVGRLEQSIGFRLPALERVNESQRRQEYSGYYNDETREIVARICAADIDRFGYMF